MWLVHHGVKGQHWGIKNGPPYPIGSENKTLFVSGSSKTQSKDSPYYRRRLPKEIRAELKSAIKDKKKIIVGDAPGIDRQVQDYLKSKRYSNVEVYGPGNQVRYSASKKWKTNPIDSGKYEPDTDEWRAEKDIVMSKLADEALAVILEKGGSQATRDNIKRVIERNKDVKIYELKEKSGSFISKTSFELQETYTNWNNLVTKLENIANKETPDLKDLLKIDDGGDSALYVFTDWLYKKPHDEKTQKLINDFSKVEEKMFELEKKYQEEIRKGASR